MDQHLVDAKTHQEVYQTYGYRYLISVMFCLSSGLNATMSNCYSPILKIMSKLYGESLSSVTFGVNLIWLVIYPPMNFVANYFLDVYGLKAGILIGNFTTLLGLWIRTLCQQEDQLYWIFIGQALGALGQPFILNSPQKVSAVWYSPESRTLSTAILSVANPVGIGFGIALTQLFVANHPSEADGLQQVYNLSLFHAILATVCLAPNFFLFKAKPPTPPSLGAEATKYGYKESLQALMKSHNYKILLVGSCLIFGAFNVISIVLEPVTAPFDFSASDAGSFGGIALLCGLIGTITIGSMVNRNKKLKSTIVGCCFISVASLVLIIIFAFYGNAYILSIFVASYGFSTTALLPLFFELYVEISFPVNEASSVGLFIAITQIFAVAASEIIDHILEIDNSNSPKGRICALGGLSILILMELIGTTLVVCVRENLRRTDYEKTGKYVDETKNPLEDDEFSEISKIQDM